MGFFTEEGLLSKAKSRVSSLLEMLWASTLSSSMIQTTKEWPKQLGLKALICSPPQNPTHSCFILHSYLIPSPYPTPSRTSSASSSVFRSLTHSFSSSSSSSAIDDWIGTESGAYTKCNEEEEEEETGKAQRYYHHDLVSKRKQQRCAVKKKKQYPPPIPLLARTGNLPGHMPWVLKRHYVDGRLILTEEKVKHHEYFEAHRENGRLILKLIPLDDTVTCCHSVHNNEEELEPNDPAFIDQEEEEKESQEQEVEEEEEEEETYKVDEDGGDDNMKDVEVRHNMHENRVVKTCSSSVPKSCLGYAGRMMSSEINLSCNSNAMDQSGAGSAPSSVFSTARPITTVV